MAAETRKRRNKTAKEMAEQLGISVRSVRNIIAEPRENFEARAAEKRARARELRDGGATYSEIAEELKVSIGSVSSLLHAKQTARAS